MLRALLHPEEQRFFGSCDNGLTLMKHRDFSGKKINTTWMFEYSGCCMLNWFLEPFEVHFKFWVIWIKLIWLDLKHNWWILTFYSNIFNNLNITANITLSRRKSLKLYQWIVLCTLGSSAKGWKHNTDILSPYEVGMIVWANSCLFTHDSTDMEQH